MRAESKGANRRFVNGVLTAALVAMVLGSVAGQATAQSPYELRAYIASPASGPAADQTDPSKQRNMGNVQAPYVCPYCGYSSYYAGECPDPYDVSGHPANVDLLPVPAKGRFASSVEVTGSDPYDYTYEADGDTRYCGIKGKTFHPQDGTNDSRSTLHLRTCDMVSASSSDAIVATTHLRFFMLRPGVTRPCATPTAVTEVEGDGNGSYEVCVNPYRVDNGDVWYMRFYRWTTFFGIIHHLRLQAYSQLYGEDFEYEDIFLLSGTERTYVTNSGAVVFKLTPSDFTLDVQYGHTFTVNSNTRLVPGAADMAALDPANLPTTGRQCWLTPSPAGVITSESVVAEIGPEDGGVAQPPTDPDYGSPYVIPDNMTGVGIVAVQYANDVAGGIQGLLTSYGWYKGGEWQYDWQETVTNEEVATHQDEDASPGNPLDGNFRANGGGSDTHQQYVQYIGECRYVSSRVELPDGGTGVEIAVLSGPGANAPGVDPATAGIDMFAFNRCTTDDSALQRRCVFCGNMTDEATTTCPLHANQNTAERIKLEYRAGADMWRKPSVLGEDETTGGTVAVRHTMPPWALKLHEFCYVYPGEDDDTTAHEHTIHIEIPPYQPPSVPAGAAGYINDTGNDLGYIGSLMVHANEGYGGRPNGDEKALSEGWDAFYRCPDCGQLVRGSSDPDGVHSSSSCPGHKVCVICGSEYPAALAGTECPFCGVGNALVARYTLASVSGDNTIQEHDLCCEEYDIDASDIQISVLRKPAMRATVPGVQVGRVDPGVNTTAPDTNVQNTVGYDAFPSNTSPHTGTQRADLPVLNEGNITSPIRIANVYDPAETSPEYSLPHYSRVDVPAYDYSAVRIAQSTPITRRTMQGYDPGDVAAATWSVFAPLPFASGGLEWLGRLQAGTSTYTIPFGQPAGTYLGQTLYFLDSDGDGALDFYDASDGYAATNTYSDNFDPLADVPAEPVYDVVSGDVRVFGSRLPQNDYFSADSSPVPIIDTGNKLQVIWLGNRPSAQGTAIPGACAPGDDSSDIPASNAPVNLLYATADYAGGFASDPLYRGYEWPFSGSVLVDAGNISNDSAAGAIASSPWAMGNDTARWVFWHRRLQHPGGTESTLRYDISLGSTWAWSGSDTDEWIYATGLPKENLRTIYGDIDDDGDTEHWLFWHTGEAGKSYLMYRWDYAFGTSNANERAVPVDNRASTEWRADTFPAVDPETGGTVTIQKPAQSPFVYTKDPSVYHYPQNIINLFFSGYIRSEAEADICWTKFNSHGLDTVESTTPNENYGKLAFSRPSGTTGPWVYTTSGWGQMPEEFKANGLRQVFSSRHLDWMCHYTDADDNFAKTPQIPSLTSANLNAWDTTDYLFADARVGLDPVFCLALIYDNIGDGTRPQTQLFLMTWETGEYIRSRGVYRVIPKLYPFIGGAPPAPPAVADGTGYLLADPSVAGRYVTMEINPATGTLSFSSPLYDVDNPGDPLAVFDNGLSLGGYALSDVAVFGSYYPYVYRITRSGADDDCPSAFYIPDVDSSRLTVFWRRNYPASSPPHYGRSGFMYKSYAHSIRVARPSIDSITTLVDADSGDAVTSLSSSAELASGIVKVAESLIGRTLGITYDSSDGTTRTEYHEVPGWSVDTPVPVRTGGAEGRLVVKPEAYTVSGANTVRYWLFWTGLSGVFDMRVLNTTDPYDVTPNAGARVGGDPVILQSADVYSAVVSPDSVPPIRERQTATVSFDPT